MAVLQVLYEFGARNHKVQKINSTKVCPFFFDQTQYWHNPFRYFGKVLKTFPDVILIMYHKIIYLTSEMNDILTLSLGMIPEDET